MRTITNSLRRNLSLNCGAQGLAIAKGLIHELISEAQNSELAQMRMKDEDRSPTEFIRRLNGKFENPSSSLFQRAEELLSKRRNGTQLKSEEKSVFRAALAQLRIIRARNARHR